MGGSHGVPRRPTSLPRLTGALALCLTYMVVEFVAGLVSHSLALLADAGHMLADAGSLALALFATKIAQRAPTLRLTYGYRRAEVLVATANAALLLAVGLSILLEAFRRLVNPPQVAAHLVLAVAVPGLLVNLAMAAILHPGQKGNLNVRAAFLHVLTDALGSVQVIVAALFMMRFHWLWADSVASVVLAVLVMYSSVRLLREALHILMEGTPAHVDLVKLQQGLLAVEGVRGVHDLHVWLIGPDFVAASLHLEVADSSDEVLLWRVRKLLAEEFHIHHATIQVEKRAPSRQSSLPIYPSP